MVKNKFVKSSAKILSPDQTDVLQNGQEFTQNNDHGRWQRPCVYILQFREMLSQMDVWPWSELRGRMRQDLRALSRLPHLHLPIALDPTRTKT